MTSQHNNDALRILNNLEQLFESEIEDELDAMSSQDLDREFKSTGVNLPALMSRIGGYLEEARDREKREALRQRRERTQRSHLVHQARQDLRSGGSVPSTLDRLRELFQTRELAAQFRKLEEAGNTADIEDALNLLEQLEEEEGEES